MRVKTLRKKSLRKKLRNITYKKRGGALCKGNTSEYEYDPDDFIGKGSFGTVYGVKGHPNLAIKIQMIPETPMKGNGVAQTMFAIQQELAIATKAGELGVGPKIHHLALCDVIIEKPSRFKLKTIKRKYTKVIWVMDRIDGITVQDIIDEYEDKFLLDGFSIKEALLLTEKETSKYYKLAEDLVTKLEKINITYGDDLHPANVIYGRIGDGPEQLWIVDYGKSYFTKTNF